MGGCKDHKGELRCYDHRCRASEKLNCPEAYSFLSAKTRIFQNNLPAKKYCGKLFSKTDRQTDRQTDIQKAYIHTDREKYRQTNRRTERKTDRIL